MRRKKIVNEHAVIKVVKSSSASLDGGLAVHAYGIKKPANIAGFFIKDEALT